MQYQQDVVNQFHSIIELYYNEAELSNENKTRENQAATKIQQWYRMHVKRIKYLKIRYNTIIVEKFAKGYLARMLMKRNSDNRYNERNLKYFSYQATQIQRYFRGYHYRKYYLNWATRKEYLTFLKRKNETFLEELKRVEQEEAQQLKIRQEQLAKTEFESLARNLHHLSSTKSISGIYNRPFGNKDIVFDMDVESHLKIVFHSNYEWEKSQQMSRYTRTKKLSMQTKLKPLK
ncbi:unnamed protein product [Paramecium pentaurelia]|uniref:IQ calmodulin-binding motif family protein n=1 Tax=Paramecium pentaurelia TaxID=43138 RepID=A0A8S1STZ9_9CILI|nr:unnamed protein product [Paramecium pentaurelia]